MLRVIEVRYPNKLEVVSNNMTKKIKKVTDIFSYIPAKQLSLDELETKSVA